MLRRVAPATVLDLGCGEGYVLAELVHARLDAKLTGIDLSAPAVANARARLGNNVEIEHGDARTLADDGRRFDVVMMLEVLEHIPNPAFILPVLETLSNRYVLLSVPNEPFFRGLNFLRGKNLTRWGNDIDHVNHWGRRSFRRFVETQFRVLEMPGVFPWTMVLAEKY